MRLIFIRHGEPDYEKDCLTALGHEQAKAVAERLLRENIDVVYTSPLGRARETADAYMKLSGTTRIQELPFMREIRYGREEALYESGNPWLIADRLTAEGCDLRDPSWIELPDFTDNTAVTDIDNICKEADRWLSTLGYGREGLYYRNNRTVHNEQTIAVFCHGGSTTAFISRVLNQEFPYMCATLHIGHTGITVLRFDRKPGSLAMPILELVNDTGHLTQ